MVYHVVVDIISMQYSMLIIDAFCKECYKYNLSVSSQISNEEFIAN